MRNDEIKKESVSMEHQFSRTELLFGMEGMKKLKNARVAVFGVGGVGGYVAEALARSGIGAIDLIDNDQVSLTNLNRQIIALHSTLGRDKVDVMKERILDICPDCRVLVHKCFYLLETQEQFSFSEYSYVVDAVDTVAAKLALVMQAKEAGTPIISSMGAGNKQNPALFEVADLYETSVCPLARVMRRELRKRGVSKLKVVYSKEEPIRPQEVSPKAGSEMPTGTQGRTYVLDAETPKEPVAWGKAVPGSTAFAPAAAGLLIASEVVKDLLASC